MTFKAKSMIFKAESMRCNANSNHYTLKVYSKDLNSTLNNMINLRDLQT